MGFLVIQTAFPFGYLIVLVMLLGLAVAGAVLLASGLRMRPGGSGRVAAGGILLGAALLIGWANFRDGDTDWNPYPLPAAALVGGWSDGFSRLSLAATGRYTCRGAACGELAGSGTWHRDEDFYVVFQPDAGRAVRWRVTRQGGRYRFVGGDTAGDPDTWRPRRTFQQDPREV